MKKKKNPQDKSEQPPGSGVWWINYYANGRQHREKVGRKSDAIDLYRVRKADATVGRKLPTLRNTRTVTISELIDGALEWLAHQRTAVTTSARLPLCEKIWGRRRPPI